VVNLPNSLVRLVGAVDERQPHVPGFHLKLSQDGVAKGFSRNTGSVRDKKNSSMGHGH
jgi:hypothetical protein